ncbi:SRPBCC family protein [Streptomycetaceae bacterium NBC_01309]
MTTTHETEHRITVDAPPDTVYALLADVAGWPLVFGPTLHVEIAEQTNNSEKFAIWATAGDAVAHWTSRRTLDPVARRIRFDQQTPRAPLATMGGEWIVEPEGDGTLVVLTHDFTMRADSTTLPHAVNEVVDANSEAELAALRRHAEQTEAADLVLEFEDTVDIDGSVEAVHDFLWRAERWPDLLPHVVALELAEDADGVQTMAMEVRNHRGEQHALRSVRVGRPGHRIVYKQLVLPPVATAHVGEWTVTGTENGARAVGRHRIALDSAGIAAVLGPDTDLATAKAAVREAIGGNSRTTLRRAKETVESLARAPRT